MTRAEARAPSCKMYDHPRPGSLAGRALMSDNALEYVPSCGSGKTRGVEMKNRTVPNGQPISAVLPDVDGTLVTKDKVLTSRALQAVKSLRDRGIVFAITSGRPPFGMRSLVEPLGLTMPMAAFNGGVIVLPDLSIFDERHLPGY